MIQTFKSAAAFELITRRKHRDYANILNTVLRKLDMLEAAVALDELEEPSGNRLEALKGDRVGQHSIRVNDQYRICFVWKTMERMRSRLSATTKRRMTMSIQRPPTGWKLEGVTTHPGEMLREEFLIPLQMSANALAMRLHIPAPRLHAILHERRAVTPDTAMRLARCFGMSAQFWLNLQAMHDLTKAQRESGKKIEQEVEPLKMPTAA